MIDPRPTIHILSDSSGETASQVLRAALAQFDSAFSVQRLPRVCNTSDIENAAAMLSNTRSLIAYTLVLPEFREALQSAVIRYNVRAVDLLGPLVGALSDLLSLPPLAQPGRSHLLDEAYFRRMEAVNFSVHYDDGRDAHGILHADVVLTGLSRTSKTPNCMYLAQQYGLKAANVPLVPGIEPPPELRQLPRGRIIGLSIEFDYLFTLRKTRAEALGLPDDVAYADLEEIEKEVRFAKRVFRELGCHVIDVTMRAIEETSSEIFLYLQRQRGRREEFVEQ
jgi:[pyruvate, water dikinase]-phosphate phosphotransferase / [pyruvate, water dikinase] kinase